MSEKKYRICLSVPLGERSGTLCIRESGGEVKGWLEVLDHRKELRGDLSLNGNITVFGEIETLVSTIPFTATGYISMRKILLDLKTEAGTYSVSGEEIPLNEKVL